MGLLPPLIFPLILFIIINSSWLSRAKDIECGGIYIANTIYVNQDGINGTFQTVQAAIDSIRPNNDQWVKVHIHAGIYTEKVTLPVEKACVILEGDGRHNTTITYGDHSQTDLSATFTSSPPNVLVTGITFKNSFNVARLARKLKYYTKVQGKIAPAVAARVYGNKTAFYKCGFIGFQDTLYDVTGRHYFKDCYIQGEMDFICGGAQSYYEDCVINATGVTRGSLGCVTAQHRNSADEDSGFVFSQGYVVGSGKVNLGRAWGPYSTVIFHQTYFDSLVTPLGWDAWNFKGQEDKITYAEVNCKGPGNDTTHRVQWEKKLNYSEIQKFAKSSFINKDGWLNQLPINFL